MRSHPRGEDHHRRCRYVEANTGEVKWGSCSSVVRHVDYAERVGQSDAYASSYDLGSEIYVPPSKRDARERKELVQDGEVPGPSIMRHVASWPVGRVHIVLRSQIRDLRPFIKKGRTRAERNCPRRRPWWCRSCSCPTSVWTRHHDSARWGPCEKWSDRSEQGRHGSCKSERSSDL